MHALQATNAAFESFPSVARMIAALSAQTTTRLAEAIQNKGAASYVAAGGTTVPPLLEGLSKTDIAWDKVHVTLSDERWLAPDSSNSNQFLIRNTLLQNKAAKAHFTPLWYACDTPEQAAGIASQAVGQMPSPFDVTLLGMGADMHAASLFPNAPGTAKALDISREALVCPVGPIKGAAGAQTRLSLSLRAILQSRIIFLMIVGDEKRAALEQAITYTDPIQAPVSAILQQTQCPVHIYWAPK
ncbi:6-phosphogluconolactonase, eukaryotic type [hydrothermal vent metagenome]|uniref:6-phosphogluconolactonase, eukaryotic type n=1 Tax=hydrothermal vent metagenome TaxID=652676 RepID=A0A3B0SH14_9ZZZZ